MRRCSETAWKIKPCWKRAFKIPVGWVAKFNGLQGVQYVFSFLVCPKSWIRVEVRVAVRILKSSFFPETREGYEDN